MRFPLRLSAALFQSKISGLLGGGSASAPIFRFSPCVTHFTSQARFDENSTELEWHSPSEGAVRARSISAPVDWIGGVEPLLHPETDTCDVGELIEFLDKKDVDGFIVTATGQAAGNSELAETLDGFRAMIRCGRWENLSRLLESSCAETVPVPVRGKLSPGSENACEEGD